MSMNTTTNLGIELIEGTEGKAVVDWAMTINGTGESMAIKVDKAIGEIINREVYSEDQPTNQKEGDIWNEVLSVD